MRASCLSRSRWKSPFKSPYSSTIR